MEVLSSNSAIKGEAIKRVASASTRRMGLRYILKVVCGKEEMFGEKAERLMPV
jgi:hypothetical protein